MAQKPTRLKRGDTSPIFNAILRDAAGDPIGLVGGDTAAFWMRFAEPNRAVKVSGAAMVIVSPGAPVGDADRGRVTRVWAPADVDTPGRFDVEVQVTFLGSGLVETFPNSSAHVLIIEQDIG